MAKFVKGDVVVVPFPFSDLSQSKRRPALVLAELEGEEEMESFDLEKAKRESGLSEQQLTQLEKGIRAEFGSDEMMFELHFIRILKALNEGRVTLEEALSESAKV